MKRPLRFRAGIVAPACRGRAMPRSPIAAGGFQKELSGKSRAAVAAQLVEHREIQRALERHDQLGQPLGRDPFPGVEFGVLGSGGVDIAVLAGKAHREPFLPLAAIAPAPGFARQARAAGRSAASPRFRRGSRPCRCRPPRAVRATRPRAGVSPGSIPPCGICQAASPAGMSMRRPTNTSPSRFTSMMPTPGR